MGSKETGLYDSVSSGQGSVMGCKVDGNEPSGAMNDGKFFNQLS
jgi:hypothetical protein